MSKNGNAITEVEWVTPTGKKGFTMPARDLKKLAEALLFFIYGDNGGTQVDRFKPFFIKKKIEKKAINVQMLLQVIFQNQTTDETHLEQFLGILFPPVPKTRAPNPIPDQIGELKKVALLPRGWREKLDLLGIASIGFHHRVVDYCSFVINLYKRAFLTPFLFKVHDQAAFIINMRSFFDESCLPTKRVLDEQFKTKDKLKDQDTYKRDLYSVTNLASKKILTPPGREDTFAASTVRFLYEILNDDTTVGRKGQAIDTVDRINPYLLRTARTTQQRPHLDSMMGSVTELGTRIDGTNDSGLRKSKRARRSVDSYKEDEEQTTANEHTRGKTNDENLNTRTYLPWSVDIPLVDDSFFLNLWLLDYGSTTASMRRTNLGKQRQAPKKPENWQIALRIEVPSYCVFLWRNDLVHSGCYAGRNIRHKIDNTFACVHVGTNPKEINEIVSNCERMHAYLPTTEQWIIDLEERTPSTYGELKVFTPFDGTLATSMKRLDERTTFGSNIPVLASFLNWPNGDKCNKILPQKKGLPLNRSNIKNLV